MRSLLTIALLLTMLASTHAAVNLAVSQQSGAEVQERADQLARQLGNELGTPVTVVVLPDATEVEAWLNRYATAELALVEAEYVASKPGQFVVIGPVGGNLILIGRRGITGDLPQRIAAVLEGRRPETAAGVTSLPPAKALATAEPISRAPAATKVFSQPKSASEDRYYVIHVYRERLNRDPDAEHLEFWTQQLLSGAVTKQQMFEIGCDLEKKICAPQ